MTEASEAITGATRAILEATRVIARHTARIRARGRLRTPTPRQHTEAIVNATEAIEQANGAIAQATGAIARHDARTHTCSHTESLSMIAELLAEMTKKLVRWKRNEKRREKKEEKKRQRKKVIYLPFVTLWDKVGTVRLVSQHCLSTSQKPRSLYNNVFEATYLSRMITKPGASVTNVAKRLLYDQWTLWMNGMTEELPCVLGRPISFDSSEAQLSRFDMSFVNRKISTSSHPAMDDGGDGDDRRHTNELKDEVSSDAGGNGRNDDHGEDAESEDDNARQRGDQNGAPIVVGVMADRVWYHTRSNPLVRCDINMAKFPLRSSPAEEKEDTRDSLDAVGEGGSSLPSLDVVEYNRFVELFTRSFSVGLLQRAGAVVNRVCGTSRSYISLRELCTAVRCGDSEGATSTDVSRSSDGGGAGSPDSGSGSDDRGCIDGCSDEAPVGDDDMMQLSIGVVALQRLNFLLCSFMADVDDKRFVKRFGGAVQYLFTAAKLGLLKVRLKEHLNEEGKGGVSITIDTDEVSKSKHLDMHAHDPPATLDDLGFVLASIHNQMNESDQEPSSFISSQTFRVDLVGRPTMDAGGPSVQMFADIASELHSAVNKGLPLFVPSYNQRDNIKANQTYHIPNPACYSPYYLGLYRRLGNIIGGAMYSGTNMALLWPTIGWKRLLDVTPDAGDLPQIAEGELTMLRRTVSWNKQQRDQMNAMDDEMGMKQFWDRLNVVRQNCELVAGGSSRLLVHKDHDRYATSFERSLLNEGRAQWEAVREGLIQVIPEDLLKLLSWNDMELFIRGADDYPLDHLRANLKVESGSEKHVNWLFEYLSTHGTAARVQFLKFASGRVCVPRLAEEWNFTIHIEMSPSKDNIPTAHVCGGSVELPSCDTKEQFDAKLELALANADLFDLT
eukprot:TRINITY_DN1312_c0_g1_i1.p1 TRINITY_DN1312_c0_g1~~TRINITY_DN1312_c0_g1_i1.p1  ORF type:complete len:900 (-),score=168.64 TRINITY_DN1312_c0_g1_i1:42-2741(-)